MKALICGVAGQDGCYLADLLLKKGYEVVGTSRDAIASFAKLDQLGIRRYVQAASMAINDFRNVLTVIQKFQPAEIYNLAGLIRPRQKRFLAGLLRRIQMVLSPRCVKQLAHGNGRCAGDHRLLKRKT